jgi:hypothetical protein
VEEINNQLPALDEIHYVSDIASTNTENDKLYIDDNKNVVFKTSTGEELELSMDVIDNLNITDITDKLVNAEGTKEYVDSYVREVLISGSAWKELSEDKLSSTVPSLQAVIDLLKACGVNLPNGF